MVLLKRQSQLSSIACHIELHSSNLSELSAYEKLDNIGCEEKTGSSSFKTISGGDPVDSHLHLSV